MTVLYQPLRKKTANYNLLASFIVVCLFVILFPHKSFAACPCGLFSVCPPCCESPKPQNLIQDAFNQYRKTFIMDSYYKNQFEKKGLMPMTDDLRSVISSGATMIGAFLDGYSANKSQAVVQSLNAETVKDYMVSDSICKFGTLTRSLAAAESKAATQRLVLSEIGLSRNLGTSNSIASSGRGRDNQSRLHLFMTYFCDPADNSSGLGQVCDTSSPPRNSENNRDIDFTRTVDVPRTLNINLEDTSLSRDENNVIALGNFLYGHRQDTKRISPSILKEKEGGADRYAMVRSIVARRAAAQNSYDTIVAMKANGSGASTSYMTNVLSKLGLGSDEINKFLKGGYTGTAKPNFDTSVNPSYYAQMDILTKKIYQDPSFYANLMDGKANVKRVSAAMEGLNLSQERDIYNSVTRSEMLLAILLELEARNLSQENIAGYNNISGN